MAIAAADVTNNPEATEAANKIGAGLLDSIQKKINGELKLGSD